MHQRVRITDLAISLLFRNKPKKFDFVHLFFAGRCAWAENKHHLRVTACDRTFNLTSSPLFKKKRRWWKLVYEAKLSSKERYLRTWSWLFCIQARNWVMELHHKWASGGTESSTPSSLFEYLQEAVGDCLRSKVEKPLGASHLARFLLLAIDAECNSDCL